MIKVSIYNQEGKVVGQQELNPKIFGLEIKQNLIHQTVVSILANQRHPFAHTKTRAEVRGGGKKPWKQKGTGRARAGSIRSPLWHGGGITFGPNKERNYNQKINKKVKKQVLCMCLSDKVKQKKLYVLNELKMPEIKTKKFSQIIAKLIPEYKKENFTKDSTSANKQMPVLAKKGKILLALPEKDLNVIRSARNIALLRTFPITGLSILNCLKADYLITTLKGIEKIQQGLKADNSLLEK